MRARISGAWDAEALTWTAIGTGACLRSLVRGLEEGEGGGGAGGREGDNGVSPIGQMSEDRY